MMTWTDITRMTRAGVVAGFILGGSVLAAESGDWPQFRGADQSGISKETEWNPQALSAGPKVLWKADVGAGYSVVSFKGDSVFTMGKHTNSDTVMALSLKTGGMLWQHTYACRGGSYAGPRATPATDGSAVYSLSREGHLLCLDAKTGAVKWEKQIMKEFGAENLKWGFSGSPVIQGDKLLINAAEHGIALDRNTGAKIWASPAGTGGYASPVVFNNGKVDCLAIFSQNALKVVELETGKKLGELPWETSYNVNAADPIVKDGLIFISSGYNKGCALLDARGDSLRQVWVNKGMRNQFSSSVLINGYLYGIDGNAGDGSLKCLEFASGQEKWSEKIGFGALTAVGEHLVAINERGDMFVIKASPSKYELVSSSKQVLDKTCWTSPVMCRGIVICRNEKGSLVALDFRK